MKVVDLFCGCGGLSLGFQMAGHDVIYGLDNNADALLTFKANFPKATVSNQNILELSHTDIPDCDILVGGPPCVNFSTSKGSRANVLEGLQLVQAFLRIVYFKKPKYWIMENVPRVGLHLPERIPLKWIGIEKEGYLPTPTKCELSANSFGAPQNRTRLLIGKYPEPSSTGVSPKTLGDVINSLASNGKITDINYGIVVDKHDLSDHQKLFMSDIEAHRIREAKTNHPYMGFMPFPDDLTRMARTVVALQMGRETLVIKDGNRFRRATVRECATIQTFPITFHFHGKSIGARYKQAGNAVAPILSYNIAKAISKAENIPFPRRPFVYKSSAPVPAIIPKEKEYISDLSKDRIIQFPGKLVRGFRVEFVTQDGKFSYTRVIEGEGKGKKQSFISDDIFPYIVELINFHNFSSISKSIDDQINSLKPISSKALHIQIHSNPIHGSPFLNKCIIHFNKITKSIEDKKVVLHLGNSPFSKKSIRVKSLLAIYYSHKMTLKVNSIF